MNHPEVDDYVAALTAESPSILVEALRGATVARGANGRRLVYPGAQAVTFAVELSGRKMALRCFCQHIPDIEEHYREVLAYIAPRSLPCLLETTFEPRGILIDGQVHPVVLMDWAPGRTLADFVEENLERPGVLFRLAKAWRMMLRDLVLHRIAHGDLQHRNVLVDRVGDEICIHLVDYDTMVVPQLVGRPQVNGAESAFRHPLRPQVLERWPGADAFPGLVVYVSLMALAIDPRLWHRLGTDADAGLLFQARDFEAPDSSLAFEELEGLPGKLGEKVAHVARALKAACALPDARATPSLEVVLSSYTEWYTPEPPPIVLPAPAAPGGAAGALPWYLRNDAPSPPPGGATARLPVSQVGPSVPANSTPSQVRPHPAATSLPAASPPPVVPIPVVPILAASPPVVPMPVVPILAASPPVIPMPVVPILAASPPVIPMPVVPILAASRPAVLIPASPVPNVPVRPVAGAVNPITRSRPPAPMPWPGPPALLPATIKWPAVAYSAVALLLTLLVIVVIVGGR